MKLKICAQFKIKSCLKKLQGRCLDGTPESWLNMQQTLDVWELERKNAQSYEQIKKVA